MRKITIYRDDSTTQVVYENVKHFFWTAGNTVLTIAQITDQATGAHRYINWPRERFCWYKDEAYEPKVPAVQMVLEDHSSLFSTAESPRDR